jgi:DNA integrity scanning protein DisA with diadenylate cyclase activity
MIISDLSDLIRAFFYLWVGVECAFLAYLYSWGYSNMKRTPIIYALKNIFIFLAVYFFFLMFIPIIKIFNREIQFFMLNFTPIFLIALIIMLRNFRCSSLPFVGKKKKK